MSTELHIWMGLEAPILVDMFYIDVSSRCVRVPFGFYADNDDIAPPPKLVKIK